MMLSWDQSSQQYDIIDRWLSKGMIKKEIHMPLLIFPQCLATEYNKYSIACFLHI